MGRHSADVVSPFAPLHRITPTLAKVTGLSAATRFLQNRKSLGFSLSLGMVLISLVNPYAETFAASADETHYVNYFEQSLVNASISVEVTRGGYEVITGNEAKAVFVELADIPSANTVQSIAYAKMAAQGWGREQYSCLVKLWNRESNWRVNAENKSSGAYGIPQALPGSKMATAGADWRTNPETQINWGIGYIKERYSTPCSALSHSDHFNWY